MSYRGEALGRPERGPGSVASLGRRLLALLIDWLLCSLIASALLRAFGWDRTGAATLLPIAVLFVERTLLDGTLGYSIGQRVTRVVVVRLSGARLGLPRAAIRSALLCLAVPAMIWNADGRGLHDLAADSVALVA